MPRSIIDVEVNSESFTRFQALFQKYQDQLAKMPEAWRNADVAVKSLTDNLTRHTESGTAEAFTEGAVAASAIADAMTTAAATTASTSSGMADIAKHAAGIAGAIGSATLSFAKWATLGATAGLLGGGGLLFGVDKLANGASDQRRQAQALGISAGEHGSFGVNFGRVLGSPDAFLQSVADIRSDPRTAWQFHSMGLTTGQIAGDDNASLSVDVIKQAKKLWDQTPANQRNQLFLDSHGFDGVVDMPTWRTIGAQSDTDIANFSSKYQQGINTMAPPDSVLKGWQDFSTQMQAAGKQVITALQTGLVGIEPGLTKLSQVLATSLSGLLGSPQFKTDIDLLGTGISKFAGWLGSPRFQSDMDTFGHDISIVAQEVVVAANWLKRFLPGYSGPNTPLVSDSTNPKNFSGGTPTWFGTFNPNFVNHHNPGNLRSWGDFPTINGFADFPDDETGLGALADQLMLYGNRDKLRTLNQIIPRYEGGTNPKDTGSGNPDHNNIAAYIAHTTSATGFEPDQVLNINNPGVLAKLLAAISKMENRNSQLRPNQLKITVDNNTGANVAIIANAVPQ